MDGEKKYFSIKDINQGWDGTFKGEIVPMVYNLYNKI